jgi:hypothetical protein
MAYIDHIAPVPATGPTAVPSYSAAKRRLTRLAGKRTRVAASSPAERHASAAGRRPTGTDRLLPAWAMGTWAGPLATSRPPPRRRTRSARPPTTPKE